MLLFMARGPFALNDGKLSEVVDKDLVWLRRIMRIWADYVDIHKSGDSVWLVRCSSRYTCSTVTLVSDGADFASTAPQSCRVRPSPDQVPGTGSRSWTVTTLSGVGSAVYVRIVIPPWLHAITHSIRFRFVRIWYCANSAHDTINANTLRIIKGFKSYFVLV